VSEGGDVLVVEDNQDMARAMLRLLEVAGYRARHAEHGLAALDAVAAKTPALVLLDMLMPVMDGWQCARELRARYGDGLPIVIVSAAEHVQGLGKEIGADEVLPKPFEMSRLLEIVARYTGAAKD
jgi:two-component system response regulator MprA